MFLTWVFDFFFVERKRERERDAEPGGV